MSGSTTHLDDIDTQVSEPSVQANALFDAMSPASIFGRRASTTAALTWGYYGGAFEYTDTSGDYQIIPNGTVLLTASSTNYVERDAAGTVSVNTVGFSGGATPLYEIITNANGVVSYIDWRTSAVGASVGGGSVTSVAMSVPAEFSVAGSPITSSGTLAVSKANQSANLVYAGPSSGGAAAPAFRTLVSADLPVLPWDRQIAVGDETTALTTGTAKVTFRMPCAVTLTAVRASLTTASSSGTPTIDINEGGTTILSTKLTIDAAELTSTTAAIPAVISDSGLADDAEITIDIDVAGTAAAGLKVLLIGTRSATP